MSRIRANTITNKAATGAPTFSNGAVVTGVCTATSFSGSGANLTSIPAGNLTGTVADARISTLTASKLTGALPAISGANLTGVGAGKLLKIHSATTGTTVNVTTPTRADTGLTVTFTPEALGSTFFVLAQQFGLNGVTNDQTLFNLYLMRSIAGGTATEIEEWYYLGNYNSNHRAYHCSVLGYLDSPSYSSGQTLNYHIEVGFYTGNYNLNYSAQNGQLKSTIFVYEMGA